MTKEHLASRPFTLNRSTAAREANNGAHRSRGYTLIEVLVVVTISSLVLTSVVAALQGLFRVEDRLRRQVAEQAILNRLAVQLRSDAHRARAIDPLPGDEAKSGFTLQTPDGTSIEYRAGEGHLTRTVKRAGRVAQRERYRLTKRARVHYEIAREPAPPCVSLMISNGNETNERATTAERIEAIVGLDEHLAKG